MSKTQTVHFTVDPTGLTRLVREMWAEGSYDKCLNLLAATKHGEPLPIAVQYEIIRGKKRFALFNGDPDSFCIEADDWKPGAGSRYPDPEPSKLAAWLKEQSRLETDREMARILRGRGIEDDIDDEGEPRRTITAPKMMKRFAGFDSLDDMNHAMLMKRNIPTIDETVAAMHSRDERDGKKPRPDLTLSAEMGWLLPDGKYYACLTKMEHVWLAAQFGKTEAQAEYAGWIKTTKDLMGERHIFKGKRDPTQSQLNTLFDWCEKHKAKLPDWAGGNP